MGKPNWQAARIGLLAILLVGVAGVTLRAFLVPSSKDDKPLVSSLALPPTIPLTGWQFIQAKPLSVDKDTQVYQYNKNGEILEIKTSYRQYDGGNVSRLLLIEVDIPPATVVMEVRYKEGIGYYGIFQYEDQAHLTACINRLGESTLTDQQYVKNKYKYGWSPQRTAWWVLGQKDLFESACLWTLVSMPVESGIDAIALDKTYQTLETAWLEWYDWWKPRW